MSTLPTSTDARTPRRERPAAGGRGAGFSTEEVQSFLETLEQHLPLGRDEWELVLSIHHQHFRAYNRTVDSLRRKFAALCRSRIPTGNPTCPEEVRLAKRVRYLMTQRADIGEGDDVNKADLGIAVEEGQQQAAEDVVGPASSAPIDAPSTPATTAVFSQAQAHGHDTFALSDTQGPIPAAASRLMTPSIRAPRPLVGRHPPSSQR
ncbi:hypothetical protein PF005_g24803 [Phytophthora fragariae]|uniref:DUF6818 domain-containing protein n=1 Tax=Phytophthora fragariae TaxID=53985 RepID=A0A6A3W3T1_9STRA|nr:hypothetical protein PF003_g10820 [Phytophthora fragariae]KAE9176707.1 hypothetical protein PF005_g24803 [Phytophthora fragariae]KAE9187163.1 hypothetical protein PF002_g25668 [Phytophthora fragariae]